jgi:hypothetical protein
MRLSRSFAYLALAGLGTIAAGGAIACGGISNPDKVSGSETTQTITGKLTGAAAPAGARVALVWRTSAPSRAIVGADVPIVGSGFTMTLSSPPAEAYVSAEGATVGTSVTEGSSGSSTSGSPGTAEPLPAPAGTSSGGSSSGGSSGSGMSRVPGMQLPSAARLRPLDSTATGTVVSDPLMGAFAGFVIYEDTNGNGQLDFQPNGSLSTSDKILGGNRELLLVALKGGGQLAYEKLRDRSGVLPERGFNLMWTERERWLPLSAIELGLGENDKVLPATVCGGSSISSSDGIIGSSGSSGTSNDTPSSSGGSSGSGGTESPPSSSSSSSGAPNVNGSDVICAPDGRSYEYAAVPCNAPAPEPPGLCSSGAPDIACASPAGGVKLPDGPIPSWWPCTVTGGQGAIDAGAAP